MTVQSTRPCPYCVNGTVTGPNGEHQRCVMCAGRGKLADPGPASGTPQP